MCHIAAIDPLTGSWFPALADAHMSVDKSPPQWMSNGGESTPSLPPGHHRSDPQLEIDKVGWVIFIIRERDRFSKYSQYLVPAPQVDGPFLLPVPNTWRDLA
jgi:hypothetical protein